MRLPPYALTLHTMLQHGKYPTNDVYIFIGELAWLKANNFQICRPTTFCIPPYLSPYTYDFPVLNCDILLFDTGNCQETYIEDIATSLFKDGANIVRYISPMEKLNVFKKDF